MSYSSSPTTRATATFGCHGNPWLSTPNLDRLASESVQLDNHHHDPLCSPSRAALLTGQYAARNGVWHVIHGRHLLHPDALTVADHYSAQGYRTAMFGKWHLGDNYPFAPRYRGFDETLCHKGGGVGELPDYWGNDYFDDTYFHNGEPLPCAGYCTDVFFAAALEFIKQSARAPFFVTWRQMPCTRPSASRIATRRPTGSRAFPTGARISTA